MTKKLKKLRIRVILALVIYIPLFIFNITEGFENYSRWLSICIFAIPYLIAGYDVIRKAIINISHGHIFDENFLMMIATVAAFIVGEYPEGAAVMIFYQIGELFQGYAVGKSRDGISKMMDIASEYANVVNEDGSISLEDVDDVEIGTTILVKPGEIVPIDGVIIEGTSFIDTSAITGESLPRRVETGDEIISGYVNKDGYFKVRTTKAYEDSTVAKILELVEEASEKKTKVENFITKFARIYTPIVTISALVLAIIPPIILGGDRQTWSDWIYRACIFLVISCPCALVISIPLGFFSGIGASSKIGVLIKGSNYIEELSKLKIIAFDKTGTLTKGEFTVTELIVRKNEKEKLLYLASAAESYSNHPIAEAIKKAYTQHTTNKTIDTSIISKVTEKAGYGITCMANDKKLLIGNETLLNENGIKVEACNKPGSHVYVAYDEEFLGTIIINDIIKEEAKRTNQILKTIGVQKSVMLTGDRPNSAAQIAETAGIDEYHAGLLPQEKVERLEELLDNRRENESLAYVGDGVNDAPVLMRADIGIAMGVMGSGSAIEAADIVIMDDDLIKIPKAVNIAKRTMIIVRQNIVFTLAIKFAILFLGVIGVANMWEAVFADVGVCVIAILNSMRAMNVKKIQSI